MAKLYLIRHGETEYNTTYRFQGQSDIPLNKNGKRQAGRLAAFFRGIPLDAIYCSSLGRARETAETIAKAKGLTPVALDAFQELRFGKWEGMTGQDIQKQYAKEWKDFFANPANTIVPGGESMNDVQQRAYPALRKILEKYPQGDVALVAHGGILRVLICTMLGVDLNRTWHLHVGNASTTCFYYWGNSYTLEYANMTYYLGEPSLELEI
ncbi:MAG: alpha-ribazole phosphatase [Acidaminococcaceae bacterium]|nr:alpha-ribazole phosphatase [Acidaminococcaceae bacterium]HAY61810.1 alpha-ribazole phosphatase [Acidaminococcaceae bacterium]HCJ91584.1 alpha-ribazole phosphatase [Acidaminococcaceae bacterium]